MRLIDADALEKAIREYADNKAINPGYIEYCNGILAVIGVVHNQPVAYSVDKVVERMEETKCSKKDANRELGCYMRNVHVDMCIAIVKGGMAPCELVS